MDSVVIQDGMMLSAEHMRIAEIIHDYHPGLELAWIPPNQRNFNDDYPYCVRFKGDDNSPPYIVFKLKENEVDHRVLDRLFNGDTSKRNVLSIIEGEEAAQHLVELKRQEDELEEAHEMAAWAFKAKSGAKHNGVRFD